MLRSFSKRIPGTRTDSDTLGKPTTNRPILPILAVSPPCCLLRLSPVATLVADRFGKGGGVQSDPFGGANNRVCRLER